MAVLTVTLNPAVDRILKVGEFSIGKDHRVSSVEVSAGGKGVNVARALNALGVAAHSLTLLDDELEKMRVNTTLIDVKGRVTRMIEPGVPASRTAQRRFMHLFKTRLRSCRHVIFSGSLPPGMDPSYLTALMGIAQKQGAWVAVDTSGLALKTVVKQRVDCVKPNRAEAQELLGIKLSTRSQIRKALHALAGCGIKDVLVSLGQDGLAGFDGEHEIFARAPVVRGGHALGCGDAALAGFVAAYLKKRNFQRCVGFAAACGAAAARESIPGGIKRQDVKVIERCISFDKE